MVTICPKRYVPFKNRVLKVYKVAGILLIVVIAGAAIKRLPGNDWLAFISLFGGLGVFLCALFTLSQIWVLDSIIIDEENKTMRVLIRRFDKLIDKGEYNIDNKLFIQIKGVRNAPQGNYRFRIKYAGKRVFGFETTLGDQSNWPYYLSLSIINKVNEVRNDNINNTISVNYIVTKD